MPCPYNYGPQNGPSFVEFASDVRRARAHTHVESEFAHLARCTYATLKWNLRRRISRQMVA
jgi:hypothetical protein